MLITKLSVYETVSKMGHGLYHKWNIGGNFQK